MRICFLRSHRTAVTRRKILALVCAVAFSACATAQTKVAIIGEPAQLRGELQQAIGSKYEVRSFYDPLSSSSRFFSGSSYLAALEAFQPDVIVDSALDAEFELRDAEHVDAFEPRLRKTLSRLANLPNHPKVLLWLAPELANNNDQADFFNQVIRPLAAQAAREADVAVIEYEHGGSGQANREAAEFLAEIVAPASLKSEWRIVRTSDFQADEGPAQQAIDGDPNTYWHSEYDPVLAKQPHEVVIDLGKEIWLAGFKYLPRQDGGVNGNVKGYEIYVGDTPDSQPTLAAKGNFTRGSSQKVARFAKSVKARYIRFVCLSEQSGGPYASAAEFDILRDPTQH